MAKRQRLMGTALSGGSGVTHSNRRPTLLPAARRPPGRVPASVGNNGSRGGAGRVRVKNLTEQSGRLAPERRGISRNTRDNGRRSRDKLYRRRTRLHPARIRLL